MWYSLGSNHNVRHFMSNIMVNISDGLNKFAEDVTNVAQPVMELSLQVGFEFLLHTAITALLG